MVLEFFAWWGEQLASLIPEPLRRSLSGALPRLVLGCDLTLGGGVISVRSPLHHGEGTRVQFGLDRSDLVALRSVIDDGGSGVEIVLQPPDGMILEKRVVLPLAAHRDLARVVGYELDRETPFSPDELYWSVSVNSRDRTQGQITARLRLILKSDVDPIIHRLRDAGITIAGIVGTVDEDPIRIAPKPWMTSLLEDPIARGRVPLLVALCTALILAAIVSPFLRQDRALALVDHEIAALQPDADAAIVLRRQRGGGGADMSDPQSSVGNPLLVLAAITEALPDDTYLSDFTQHHREIGISGQSADAAALIERLSVSPVLRDPGFSAPVTRDPGSNNDSFSIKLWARQP